MAEQFYTILTAVGKAKIANAAALGEKVELTEMALGDGDGSYYNPTEDQTELRNEVWRGAINAVDVDTENPNWITIQTVVPSQHGGFMIREAGVFDNEGDLIAVGKYPETYKPVPADGSIKDLVVRMILEVSNAASVVLKVDPTVVLATQQQVNEAEVRAKAYTDQTKAELEALYEALYEAVYEALYPIGTVYENAITSANPATYLGFGTWEPFGQGRVTVGVDGSQSEFNSVQKTGGAKTHTLTIDEMPSHTHQYEQYKSGDEWGQSPGNWDNRGTTYWTTRPTGGGQPHNNLQPYITVYRWLRTA